MRWHTTTKISRFNSALHLLIIFLESLCTAKVSPTLELISLSPRFL